MKQELLAKLDETTNEMLQTVASFSQEQFNKVPFEGSWTAAQVAEHILKSEVNIPKVWQGNAVPTERNPEEHVPVITSIFLNYDNKMKSPDFILPSDGPQQKDDLYNALKKNREEIKSLAGTIDLTRTFPDFAFPKIGSLTGIECLTFISTHSQRHTHQLKNIYEKLNR